jgi:adenine phosphoribosyltransferase
LGDGFYIYSFDMTGECEWNRVAAKELLKKLAPYDFDGFVTVQTKSCGLTQQISANYPKYLEVRKSKKAFMVDPVGVTVQSITTHGKQELWIGKEKYQHFVGKKLCFLDDVVSTGGTIDAMLELAPKIGIEISVIACVLTEGVQRTEYKGIPLVSLDHIPLPGKISDNQ